MKQKWMIALLCAGLIGLIAGCRDEEDANMMRETNRTTGRSDPPETRRDPAPWFDGEIDGAPMTLPTGYAPGNGDDYATDVLITAGCEMNPDTAAVAKQHGNPSLCEHVVATPARNDDGDFYEVASSFLWGIADADVADVPCMGQENDGYCHATGKEDVFDTGDEEEPATLVMACAVNHCPDPRPPDCADLVCASVTIASVVNLEGAWILNGATFDPPLVMSPAQDGRSFADATIGLQDGAVDGTSVSFSIGDYLYEGTFAGDRDHLQGEAWELMTLSSVGAWSAERASP